MEKNDKNDDGFINMDDKLDIDHLAYLIAECDEDNNGTLDACEVHACSV